MLVLVWLVAIVSKLYPVLIIVAMGIGAIYYIYFDSHSLDKEPEPEKKPTGDGAAKSSGETEIAAAIMRILGWVAKANPEVTNRENFSADNIINRLNPKYNIILRYAFEVGCSSFYDPQADARLILKNYGWDKAARVRIVSFLVFMALSDNKISAEEKQRVVRVAAALHVSEKEVEKLIREMGSYVFDEERQKAADAKSREFYNRDFSRYSYTHEGREEDASSRVRRPVRDADADYRMALTLLNVTDSTPPFMVKRAYMRLIKKYHPDLIKVKGLPEDMVSIYEEKTKEINEAYDIIKERRGFR